LGRRERGRAASPLAAVAAPRSVPARGPPTPPLVPAGLDLAPSPSGAALAFVPPCRARVALLSRASGVACEAASFEPLPLPGGGRGEPRPDAITGVAWGLLPAPGAAAAAGGGSGHARGSGAGGKDVGSRRGSADGSDGGSQDGGSGDSDGGCTGGSADGGDGGARHSGGGSEDGGGGSRQASCHSEAGDGGGGGGRGGGGGGGDSACNSTSEGGDSSEGGGAEEVLLVACASSRLYLLGRWGCGRGGSLGWGASVAAPQRS
jgi:hypothetical protein